MYFTGAKLRPFESEMKKVPFFDKKEVWDEIDYCKECKNFHKSLDKCMRAHCPNLQKKFMTDRVNTHKLFKTFLTGIGYTPFKNRLQSAMKGFSGNRLFMDLGHCERFSREIAFTERYAYNKMACLYVLTMYPYIWENVVESSGRYYSIEDFPDRKTQVFIEFANELGSYKKIVDLKGMANCRKISNTEFVYLCNAMLIRRFGLSVIKLGD